MRIVFTTVLVACIVYGNLQLAASAKRATILVISLQLIWYFFFTLGGGGGGGKFCRLSLITFNVNFYTIY